MYDRIPSPGKENRVSITQDNGQVITGVLAYADDATQEGSAYTKGNVLPDDVCSLLGIDPDTSEPKDAWLGVIAAMGYAILTIAVTQVDGTPLSGFVINGIPNVITEKLTTDSNGKVYLIIPEGEYSLTIPTAETIDSTYGTKAITAVAGQAQSVTWQATSNGTSRTFSSSQSGLKFSSAVDTVDVFCCGGGGGGGGSYYYNSASNSGGGGGGGGGYTKTSEGVAFTPWSTFEVTVGGGGIGGAGGAGPSSKNGGKGGTSSALGVSASGGYGGKSWSVDVGGDNRSYGGSGGSGGGGGKLYGASGNTGYDGGSDGSDGEGRGGTGQGTTTLSMLGTLCSGGGAGGGYYVGTPGSGSVGRGGNGGKAPYGSTASDQKGKNGSAGRVELRWTFKQ